MRKHEDEKGGERVNEENLRMPSTSEAREIGQKGGINSGKSRRKKADMRKAVQSMLDNTYSDNSGKELSGAEIMALKLFKIATNEKDKNCIAAIKLIIELTGQNKDTLTDKKTKAEIKLLEARIKALSGLDETESKKLLDNINKILSDVDSVIE